jgi:hypothetical protein
MKHLRNGDKWKKRHVVIGEGKDKQSPHRPVIGPQGSRILRLPDFQTTGIWW